MSRTKKIYFLSAFVLIIGCYALNLSYSLFTQTVTPENNTVDATVPYLSASLETSTFTIPANSSKLLKLKIINTGNSELKYGISVDDTKDLNIQLVSGYNIVGTISAETEETEVWVYVTNDTDNEVTDLTFSLAAKYTTLLFDEEDFISKSNIDCENLYYLPIPNEPVLAEGMIPVVYDETCESTTAADNASGCWEVADKSTEWYNYDDQMWANAVTTSVASYRTASAGTEIPMSTINSMWVWIPRYKYMIPSNIRNVSNVENPPQIDVIFENQTETTGVTETVYRTGITSDGTNINYYTHPSFRNVDNIEYDSSTYSRGAWDEETTGFWVGKFETGNNANTPLIKPDIISLTNQNVSTQFLTSLKFAGGTMDGTTGVVTFTANPSNVYGLNTTSNTTDTHMMKNTEWGAVAILSQSQYGKMGNSNYTGSNKEVYANNSSNYYTGRSSGNSSENVTTYGTYSYNDRVCSSEICTGDKITNSGTGASTTGTIYGVYDMRGGTAENVMGNFDKFTGYEISNSGFNGSTDMMDFTKGIEFPESKYYDLYLKINDEILGDATRETQGWYDCKGNLFVRSGYPWFYRSTDSIFCYDSAGGSNDDLSYNNDLINISSFRTVLVP